MKNWKRTFELSLALAKAEFKERNEGSYLGVLWYLLDPLLMFFLLLFIFSSRLGGDISNYPLYILLGITLFNLFQKATIEATQVTVFNNWIIKSINFQRGCLISAIVLRNVFSHLFEIILFIAVAIYYKTSIIGLIYYPLILIFFCIFIFGVSLVLSAVTIYFADFENIWIFVSRLIWLGTPLFYSIDDQGQLFKVNLFNPVFYFITIARDLIIYSKVPETWMVLGAVIYSLISLLTGLLVFKKLKNKFAELL